MIRAGNWDVQARNRVLSLAILNYCSKLQKELIASLTRAYFYHTGDIIITGQEKALLFILEGSVVLYGTEDDEAVVDLLEAGNWLGHQVPFFSYPHHGKLVANGPGVLALLSWNRLEQYCEEDSQLGYNLLKGMSRYVDFYKKMLFEIKSNTPRGKMLRLIFEFGVPQGQQLDSKDFGVKLPFTPKEIGLLLNMDEDELVSLIGLL